MEKKAARAGEVSIQQMQTTFYIYGYDPRVGRFYSKHLKDNLAKQLAEDGDPRASDLSLTVNSLEHTVLVPAAGDGEEAQVVVPSWSRIIYDTITRNRLLMAFRYNVIVMKAVLDGSFVRYFQVSWKFTSAVAFFFLAPVVLALLMAIPFYLFSETGSWLHAALAVLVFAGAYAAAWSHFSGFLFVRYLFWSICFVGDLGGTSKRLTRHLPALDAKLDEIAEGVLAVLRAGRPDDTVTIVGHSTGAILALAVAARLANSPDFISAGYAVRLMTLGGTWGILALGAGGRAKAHRREIVDVLNCEGVTWYDVAGGEDIITVPYTYLKMRKILKVKNIDIVGKLNYVDPLYPTLFQESFYRKNMRNFLLLHFQYIDRPQNILSFNLFKLMLYRWKKIEGDGTIIYQDPQHQSPL